MSFRGWAGFGLLLLGLAGIFGLSTGNTKAQIVLSYGSLETGLDSNEGRDLRGDRGYLALGYDLPFTRNFTLRPTVGLVSADHVARTTITDPDGVTFGVWGQYDLLSYALGDTYARGGVTYMDYEISADGSALEGSELQFALGVGADFELREGLSAYTSLNYVLINGDADTGSYDGAGAGLEVGIELSF